MGFLVKRILVAAALAGLSTTSALAADLGAKAPSYTKAPVMSPAYDWSGFYIGGNVGGAWRPDGDFLFTQPGGTFDPLAVQGTNKASVIGGLHAGYNWQTPANIVLGVEGDFSWTDAKRTVPFTQPTVGGVPATTGLGNTPITVTASDKLDWLSSLRGRLGYSFGSVLIYGTGGVAWGHTTNSLQMTNPPYDSVNGSFSKVNTGWVAGAGLDYKLTSNWIIRGEYLHYGFNGVSNSYACPACVPIPSGNPVVGRWSNQSVDELRFGVSYQFAGPVVAKY